MNKKKILVLYTSAGYGHKKIGENIAAVLQKEHDVDLLDLFKVAGGKTASWGTRVYLGILKFFPGLWEFFYTNNLFLNLTLPLRTKLAKYKAISVANVLFNNHYDVVITTQVTASAIVSSLKSQGLYKGSFGITFSDFHLHRYWLFDNADFYLANIPEQKNEMIKMGIPAEKIFVCGITMPEPQVYDKQLIRKEFGVGETEKIVLLLGGGRGLGLNTETVSQLARSSAQVFVVCGLNEEIKTELEKEFKEKFNVKILGFVDYLPKLYAIADIVVTKPGGLSIAEALQFKIPILISSFIPGQERLNYEYLVEKNLIMPEITDLYGPVEDELKTGSFTKALSENKNVDVIVQHGSEVTRAINVL